MAVAIVLLVAVFFTSRLARVGIAVVPDLDVFDFEWIPGEASEPGSPSLYAGVGRWQPAAELAWSDAWSGWQAISLSGSPTRWRSFTGLPMTIGGHQYDDGIGTYPYSEITIELDRKYSLLRTGFGVDDRSPTGAGAIAAILIDDDTVYRSPALRRGDPVHQVTVSLSGAQELRLVVARDPSASSAAYADWVETSLFEPLVAVGEVPRPDQSNGSLQTKADLPTKLTEREFLSRLAQEEERYVLETVGRSSGVAGATDAARRRHVLANADLAIVFDAAGAEPNSFTVLDRRNGSLIFHSASVRIEIDGSRAISLSREAAIEDDNVVFRDADQPGIGSGRSMTIRLRAKPDDLVVVLRFVLFPNARVMVVQADVPGAAPTQQIDYAFFAREVGPAFVGAADAEVLADFTRLRHMRLVGNDLVREIATDFGKPVIFWGRELSGAVVMAPLGETTRVPWIQVTPSNRSISAGLAFVLSSIPHDTASPRLLVELRPSADLRDAAATYKRILDVGYPQPPMPGWVRYQWSSWYPFEMDITHDILARQVDLIERHFGDLGPWHVVLDAGWYVAEGRPGASLRTVDRAKFPRGIRSIVGYIHRKGMKLIIYVTTPYVDSGSRQGDWSALRGTIDERPEWLIPLGTRGAARGYVFDYAHPGLQADMHGLFGDVLRRFDADGLLVDGLGSGPDAFRLRRFIDHFGSVRPAVEQTNAIYRFNWESASQLKQDIYIEGGVHNPAFARPYAHTFRLADDAPSFSSPYPVSGLVEHIDYATYQKAILGQRPNMGALSDEAGASPINIGWLQAGIALDSQVTLSFDLARLESSGVAEFRGLLNHYRPFTGITTVDQALEPSTFVTVKDGIGYLGLLNRAFDERRFGVPLDKYGLRGDRKYSVFDASSKQASAARGVFETTLGPQSFRLFIIAGDPAVIWTTSSYSSTLSPGQLTVQLAGPAHVAGVANVVVPPPRRVTFDGTPMSAVAGIPGNLQYRYDEAAGVLTVAYPHDRPRRLIIEF